MTRDTRYYCPRCRGRVTKGGPSRPFRIDICPMGRKDGEPGTKVRLRRLKDQRPYPL